MDGRRFDNLTRAVADRRTRRSLVRALALAFSPLAPGRQIAGAVAQTGYLGPGEACFDSSQCGDTRYSQMFCDDNGYDYDGPLNCCTYQYGYCYSDEGCCGSLVCVEGSCSDPAMVNLPLGAQCFYVEQCLGNGMAVDCADNGGFVSACCLTGGQRCTADIDCCSPNLCARGYCR